MVRVLEHDEIYYEPILSSLDEDIVDQTRMIKFIIDLGLPVIDKFQQLKRDFRRMEERSHYEFQTKINFVAELRKRRTFVPIPAKHMRQTVVIIPERERYMRETKSMAELKNESVAIEKLINELKYKTLCAQANEIYPQFVYKNFDLWTTQKLSQFQGQGSDKEKQSGEPSDRMRALASRCNGGETNFCEYAAGCVSPQSERRGNKVCISIWKPLKPIYSQSVLPDRRLTYIETLKNELRKENEIQKDTLEYIQNRAKAFIMIR